MCIRDSYYSAAGRTATPEASEESGATLEPGTVVYLTTGSKNAAIYYSTDGTDPTRDNLENLTQMCIRDRCISHPGTGR